MDYRLLPIGLLFLLLLSLGCVAEEPATPTAEPGSYNRGVSVFILNEGTFQRGNASVSHYDKPTQTLTNGIFERSNGLPLGDVLQSVSPVGETAYLLVNNSGLIEQVEPATFRSLATIRTIRSPRYLLPLGDGRAYVSDFAANMLSILDLSSRQVIGTIALPGWTEQMVLLAGRVYVGSPQTAELLVVDPKSDQLVDRIPVGDFPTALLADKNQNLWVLCLGEDTSDGQGELYRLRPGDPAAARRWPVPAGDWSRLALNGRRDTLYLLNQSVYRLAIDAAEFPARPFLSAGSTPYGLGVDPVNGDIYIADAVDFQRPGRVYRFRADGAPVDTFGVGVIPNGFWFY